MKEAFSKRFVGWLCLLLLAAVPAWASDHDDGENDVKSRSLNLTDLYVFREGDQTGNDADNANLILIMNTNPRSVARQQYYFSTQAQYEFHVTQLGTVGDPVTGEGDVILRFEFGEPLSSTPTQQPVTVTAIVNGNTTILSTTTSGGSILTTPLGATPINNDISIGGSTLTVFAGLREDPFFFDVECYFRVRAALLGIVSPVPPGPPAPTCFRDASTAVDFAKGYNVNAIVVRVPIALLGGAAGATVFDVWELINLPDMIATP